MSHAFDSKALELSRQAITLFFEQIPGVQLQAQIQNLFIEAMEFAAPAVQAEQLSGNTEQVSHPYTLTFDQWLSRQTGKIDVDCGCVTTEAFFHWLRVAYEAGNSPTIPDGWIPVSERLPDIGTEIFYFCQDDGLRDCAIVSSSNFSGGGDAQLYVHAEGYDLRFGVDITHWMPLPAAPKQEAE